MTRRAVAASAALATLAFAPAAVAAPIKPGGSYKGTTSQGKAVSAKISADGASLQKFKIRWSSNCGEGRTYDDSTVFEKFALPASGKLDIAGPYDDNAFDGLTGHHKVALHGRFTQSANGGYTLKGTFSDVIKVDSPASTAHYTCKTGNVSFTAKA